MARKFFLHLYMLRIPIVILIVLGVLLPLAFGSPMLHGLADLETNQIALVSLGAFLLLSAAMTCAFLVLLYGSERADGKRSPMVGALASVTLPQRLPLAGWMVGTMYAVGNTFYFSFLYAVLRTMREAHVNPAGLTLMFWWQSLLGMLIGWAIIIVVFIVNLWISEPRQAPQIEVFALPIAYLFRQSSWLPGALQKLSQAKPTAKFRTPAWLASWRRCTLWVVDILGPGYGRFDANGKAIELNPGHAFAAMLALACLVLYMIAGAGGHHRLYSDAAFGPPQPYDAVLLQVMLLLLLSCWLLSGISFYFDRFHVVVLIPIAAFLFATSHFGSSDHAFHTETTAANVGASLPKPEAKFAAASDHVIVIAAAGGGIQAAAWTSRVLCGLRQELGAAFDRDVLAISGVSGGSVGTMFYLRCRESPEGDTTAADAAMNSSLEAVAWGLAHPDLQHAILPIQGPWWKGDDRGWALERALRKNAQFSPPDRLLASPSSANQWPALLFNSTEVRTGDPLVFTNTNFPPPVPDELESHRVHEFHQVYGGRDVKLETAVRMSAAFPYVSPASRADTPWNAEHLVDGGYFENSGLFSLGEWLKEAAVNTQDERGHPDPQHPPKKILVMRIDAFPDSDWEGPADQPKSWAYQTIAPVDAILHVRSEGQLVRDAAEGTDLLELLSRRGYEASAITARYVPSAGSENPGPRVNCPADPPLTWHLTEVEKRCIHQNWDDIKGSLAGEVRAFLVEGLSTPSPAKAAANPPTAAGLSGKVHSERLKKGLYVHKMVRR